MNALTYYQVVSIGLAIGLLIAVSFGLVYFILFLRTKRDRSLRDQCESLGDWCGRHELNNFQRILKEIDSLNEREILRDLKSLNGDLSKPEYVVTSLIIPLWNKYGYEAVQDQPTRSAMEKAINNSGWKFCPTSRVEDVTTKKKQIRMDHVEEDPRIEASGNQQYTVVEEARKRSKLVPDEERVYTQAELEERARRVARTLRDRTAEKTVAPRDFDDEAERVIHEETRNRPPS